MRAPTDEPVSVEPGSDGTGRRKVALTVVVVAVVAGVAGGIIGNQIQSPADRAASREAPVPSLITVPVERRALSSELVLSGSVDYNEPTMVQLAGGVGIEQGETAVVTDIRPTGEELQEGDVLLEVTGRPVLVLEGNLPMYRRLTIGSEGPDVAQLEAALQRLGYAPGVLDSRFDADTATAVEAMYTDAGYVAEGPNADERAALQAAQESVQQAEANLASVRQSLADANRPLLASEKLQLDRSLQTARDAVPAARQAVADAQSQGDRDVASARASRDTAAVQRDAAVALRDQAVSGAVDPDTGAPYSAERIAQLQADAALAQEAFVAADAALGAAQQQRTRSVADAQAMIADAEFQVQLTEAQYAEATAGGDTSALREAVSDAEAAVADAAASRDALQASTGLRVSPGEIVFVPVMPTTLTESYVGLGSEVQGPIGTLATASTLVSARVSRVDSALVAVGAAVSIEIRGSGLTTTGTVLSVGAPAAAPPGGDQFDEFGGPSPQSREGGGRLVVTIDPDDPDLVAQYVFWDARVVVSVASTDGEVLVVPVAAITVGPDEVSQVEIERTPATDDEPAVTELVDVEVGLTSRGLAEVRPIDGDLDEGDRVVVGVETNERLNEDDTEGPDVADDDGDGGDDGDGDGDGDRDGGDDGDDGDGDGGDDDGEAASPLAALFGFDFDPVESRRQQLEVEEQTAACMRDLGFEYTPVDYSAQMPAEEELRFTDPDGFGEQYGYGVMYSYELYETGDGPGFEVEFVDPNQEYVDSLSPDEQNAYYEALWGSGMFEEAAEEAMDEPAGDGADEEVYVAPPIEEQGCQGQAWAEVSGSAVLDNPEIQDAIGSLYENLQNDPRIAAADDTWATCMAPTFDERGITDAPDNPDRMYEVAERAKNEALGLEIIEVSSEAEMEEYFASGEDVYSATYEEGGGGFVYLGRPDELSGEEIDRLIANEVELWTADRACQEEADFSDVRREVEADMVEQLVAQFPELGDG